MIAPLSFRHSALAVMALVVGCGGPTVVIHIEPLNNASPTVNVSVCPVGQPNGDCAPASIFTMDSTQTRTLALYDNGHDAAVAVLFQVSDLGPVDYCQQLPALDLVHGSKDFTVAIDSCSIQVRGLTPVETPTGCTTSPLIICGPANDCGATATTVCDGNGNTIHPVCCTNGQICDSSRTCSS